VPHLSLCERWGTEFAAAKSGHPMRRLIHLQI
jgi:hypothetical protein